MSCLLPKRRFLWSIFAAHNWAAISLRAWVQQKMLAVPVASAQFVTEDLAPGGTTLGVIVLRHQLSPASVLRIVFPDDGVRHVSATFVF